MRGERMEEPVLLNSESDIAITEYYSSLSQQISNATSRVQARIANGFFLNKEYILKKSYEDKITKKYAAKVESLDFNKADETAKIINDFVSNATENKITKLVNEEAVKDAFSLVVNAIYLKAKWNYKFLATNSVQQEFFSLENISRQIDFMNDYRIKRLYAEDSNVEVLSLQSVSGPQFRFGLEELRKSLDGTKVQNLLSKLSKTYISVDEEGTTAAAATAFVADNLFAIVMEEPKKFVADHPFLFILTKDKHPLFMGQFVDEEGTTAAAATAFVADNMFAIVMEEPKKFVADHPFLFILTKDMHPLFMGQVTCQKCSFSSFPVAGTDFGLKMLHNAPVGQSLVVSPLSVIFALAMVQVGAKGSTKSQINNAISKGSSDKAIIDYYSDLSQEVLKAKNGVLNRIANGFFLNKDYQIKKEYQDKITEKFSARIEAHDFQKAEQTAEKVPVQIINKFVSNVTEGKIQNMVQADVIRGAFSLIVNAIYFTAKWDHKFYKWGNSKKMFFTSKGNGREVMS
ncbi:unnamed protein product [Strongylus vulgaris]|uniref:Serpin domain-containing protein n=1 Tax=Strongylus vulgaris TaxID=40348 RepID=A0A3P7L796_STRVU|nr:unnamed protein product [Strongylus vulgaris]